MNNWPCPLYVRAGSDAKRRAPRTATDSIRTSSLTCGFTAMASPDHTRTGQRPASRAAAPRARHPWTPHAGSAPSNCRADNVRPGRRPKDHSGMSSAHNTGQARSTNRAPHAAAPRPRPQDQDLRVLGGVTARQEHQPTEHPDHGQAYSVALRPCLPGQAAAAARTVRQTAAMPGASYGQPRPGGRRRTDGAWQEIGS